MIIGGGLSLVSRAALGAPDPCDREHADPRGEGAHRPEDWGARGRPEDVGEGRALHEGAAEHRRGAQCGLRQGHRELQEEAEALRAPPRDHRRGAQRPETGRESRGRSLEPRPWCLRRIRMRTSCSLIAITGCRSC